ncbi:hypothetical protein CEQ90_05635 [Lewinellaceae bacterium SD302]|nr:hypothetical protein CEQ90_05635 [Lewinellaceae bacterium SD302]
MKYLKLFRTGWYVAFGLFILHQITQRLLGWEFPLIDHYLDPLLCIPLVLGIMAAERKLYFGAGRMLALETLVLTIFLAILFEEVFTRISSEFSRDIYDYLAYALGGIYFWMLVNPRLR